MSDATTSQGRASPPDPPQDRSGGTVAGRTVPQRIAAVLHAVRILLGYGRHLKETASQRAVAPNFTTIAVNFGTTRVAAILAHLERGILRAMALEHVLLERAAAGRDIAIVEPRSHARPPAEPPAASAPPEAAGTAPAEPPATATNQEAASHSVARTPVRRAARPAHADDPELFMPTLEELVAQVRRRPIGRTIAEICLDCGVVPGLCTGQFWNVLFDILRLYGGSLPAMMRERARRRDAFKREQDRRPTSNWQWWDLKRDTILRVVGFFIGEPPVNPFAPPSDSLQAAATTGPP